MEAAAKRVPKRVEGATSELKYYKVQYTCLFGGKVYIVEGLVKEPIKSKCGTSVTMFLHVDIAISNTEEKACSSFHSGIATISA